MQEQQYVQEDEIDLKELFKTLWAKKVFIALFTSIVTILAIIYALTIPKVYEVSAMMQIGKLGKNSNIENTSSLVKKLEITTGINSKRKKEYPYIDKIQTVKGTNDLIEVYSQGLDNESSIVKINRLIETIKTEHKKKIDEFLDITKEKLIGLKIQRDTISSEIIEIKNAITKNSKSNVTLASLILLKDLNAQLSNIDKEINDVQISISENNIKNTELIGELDVSEFPVKPKKKLIVVVAFVTGFILSIFLVFFMEFIRGFKEEEALEAK